MDQQLLDKVLACPTLPSLPAVALRVIELTNNPDVSIDELAKAIRFDQALSARILRTVNSSYYGLRERCTTIHKALLLLGMRPVKSLVLGFSLVDAFEDDDAYTGFNYREYWRRALYASIGARELARLTDSVDPDEAFLAGMLQDVGMIALHEALGEVYDAVLAETGGDHAKLCRSELEHFEIQHPDVGAMLAEQWNFPAELTVPIRFHERPTAAPGHAAMMTRCVALGGAIHDALTEEDPTPALRRLYTRCKQWFNVTPSVVDDVIKAVADSARNTSRMFQLDTGARADATRILAAAEQKLVELSREDPRTTFAGEELTKTFDHVGESDPLTGAVGPGGFDHAVRAAFGHARQGEMALSIVQVKIDRFDQIADVHGEIARDELTIGLAAILHQHFDPLGGVVCRPTPTLFSVVLPGTPRHAAVAASDSFRTHLSASVARWMTETPALHGSVSASVGIATLDRHTAGAFSTPDDLITGATQALRAALAQGGNAVHEHEPRARAA